MGDALALHALKISPWSERARWALAHHGLAHREVEHVPMMGELRLRRLAKSSRASVPLLVANGEAVLGSWDIARYADRAGTGAPLIPPEHEAAVAAWVQRADRVSDALRAMVLRALLDRPRALDELAPPFVPAWARPAGRPMVKQAVRFLLRKYDVDRRADADLEADIARELEVLRDALSHHPSDAPYVLGAFGYADIAMASTLQGLRPVDDRHLRLGPATRALWTREPLANAYADLLAWRDRLYERRRGTSG